MSTALHTTWGEFRLAVAHTFDLVRHDLCIFDADLAQLGLDQLANIERLERLLHASPAAHIRIALQRTEHLHRDHPRLLQLLQHYGHALILQQTPEHLVSLRDTLVIADACHAVIRFDRDHPRSKSILACAEAVQPYQQRFDDIWREGGYRFSPTVLGL